MSEQRIIALVIDPDSGEVYDRTYTWETAQNYVLHGGMIAKAIADDGPFTKANQQRLYDAERERYLDCWT